MKLETDDLFGFVLGVLGYLALAVTFPIWALPYAVKKYLEHVARVKRAKEIFGEEWREHYKHM